MGDRSRRGQRSRQRRGPPSPRAAAAIATVLALLVSALVFGVLTVAVPQRLLPADPAFRRGLAAFLTFFGVIAMATGVRGIARRQLIAQDDRADPFVELFGPDAVAVGAGRCLLAAACFGGALFLTL